VGGEHWAYSAEKFPLDLFFARQERKRTEDFIISQRPAAGALNIFYRTDREALGLMIVARNSLIVDKKKAAVLYSAAGF
jgi:hypothetical protein